MLARDRAREQHAEHVRAGDDEQQRRAQAADEVVVQRHDGDIRHPGIVAVFGFEPARDRAEPGARPLDGHAGCEPADRVEVVCLTGSKHGPELARRSNVRAVRVVEAPRHHADHGMQALAERERL